VAYSSFGSWAKLAPKKYHLDSQQLQIPEYCLQVLLQRVQVDRKLPRQMQIR
jgi:hypothetical protein